MAVSNSATRTLYLAGEYPNSVAVNASFVNGNNCEANGDYSHAEGDSTVAEGADSHATGIYSEANGECTEAHGNRARAVTNHARSYVWNGVSGTGYYESKGEGTFSINPKGGKSGFYIGEESLQDIVDEISGSMTGNYAMRDNDNVFISGKTNTFNGTTNLVGGTSVKGNIIAEKNGNVTPTFNFTQAKVTVPTQSTTSNDTSAASTSFVHSVIQAYLKNVLNTEVIS